MSGFRCTPLPLLQMMNRVTRAEQRRLGEDVEELTLAVAALEVRWEAVAVDGTCLAYMQYQ